MVSLLDFSFSVMSFRIRRLIGVDISAISVELLLVSLYVGTKFIPLARNFVSSDVRLVWPIVYMVVFGIWLTRW